MEEIVSSRRKLFRFQIDQYDYECITAKVGFKKSHSIKTCKFHLGMILFDYIQGDSGMLSARSINNINQSKLKYSTKFSPSHFPCFRVLDFPHGIIN